MKTDGIIESASNGENTPPNSVVNSPTPWKVGKPFRNMPQHKGWVFPIRCPETGYLVAHVYANALGKDEAKNRAEFIVESANCHKSALCAKVNRLEVMDLVTSALENLTVQYSAPDGVSANEATRKRAIDLIFSALSASNLNV